MVTDDMTKEEREEYWQMVIDEFHESNVTKTEYCKNNDIAVSTFNYWDARLKEKAEVEKMGDGRFVELSVPAGEEKTIRFSEGVSCDFKTEAILSLESIKILVNCNTPKDLIETVLEAVGYAK